jgi:hypothetical protein
VESRFKIIIIIIIIKMGHQYNREITREDGISEEDEGDKRGYLEVKRLKVYYMHMYEDSIMKPTKYCLKWEYNGGGELVQGKLYASMKFYTM